MPNLKYTRDKALTKIVTRNYLTSQSGVLSVPKSRSGEPKMVIGPRESNPMKRSLTNCVHRKAKVNESCIYYIVPRSSC